MRDGKAIHDYKLTQDQRHSLVKMIHATNYNSKEILNQPTDALNKNSKSNKVDAAT